MDEEKKSVGPIIGIIIIILIVIAGAIYLVSSKITGIKENTDQQNTAVRNEIASTPTVSDLENDLNLINVEDTGADLLNDKDFAK